MVVGQFHMVMAQKELKHHIVLDGTMVMEILAELDMSKLLIFKK